MRREKMWHHSPDGQLRSAQGDELPIIPPGDSVRPGGRALARKGAEGMGADPGAQLLDAFARGEIDRAEFDRRIRENLRATTVRRRAGRADNVLA